MEKTKTERTTSDKAIAKEVVAIDRHILKMAKEMSRPKKSRKLPPK